MTEHSLVKLVDVSIFDKKDLGMVENCRALMIFSITLSGNHAPAFFQNSDPANCTPHNNLGVH